ncbi:putative holin, partial [Klebsiella pneumoniae]
VIGAPLLGSYFSKWTGYRDRPLDALGAVIVAAIAIKLLTFVNSQDLGSLFGILSRLRGGGTSNGNK